MCGNGLPVTGQVRLVANGLAPSFFATIDVDGNELRELVQHLPAGTQVPSGTLIDGGALQIATLLNASTELKKLALFLGAVAVTGVVLAVVLGYLVARTALVPLNSLTDTVEDLAETTDVSRRLSPGGSDELGRLRRTFNRLLEALESSRRAQSRLVLDASHELRTPLTSLRTNLEVIRRVDELSDEDRSVLVDDVLVQLQELTDTVGDLAELARGDQTPAPAEPLRLDLLVGDAVVVANTHGPGRRRVLRVRGRALLGRGPCRSALPRRGQPPRQRPQVEPTGPARDRASAVPTVTDSRRRARPRPRHRRGRPAADLRPLLPLARGAWIARVGPRSGHRGPGGQGGGRHRHGGERLGGRGPHDHAPVPPCPPPPTPSFLWADRHSRAEPHSRHSRGRNRTAGLTGVGHKDFLCIPNLTHRRAEHTEGSNPPVAL